MTPLSDNEREILRGIADRIRRHDPPSEIGSTVVAWAIIGLRDCEAFLDCDVIKHQFPNDFEVVMV